MNFGVQTFTIRKKQKKSIREAYLPLISLGVRSFEVARIDFTEQNAEELKALSEEFGIEISAIQVKPKHVFGEVDRILRFCSISGCNRVIISMLPFDCILGKDEKFYSFIEKLDAQFDLYASHGITLGYHHHNWEYIPLLGGGNRMSELLRKTERIRFVHDTYWTARCGICPTVQIKEFGHRLLGVHLRDLSFKKRGIKVIPKDCHVGGGVIDFEEVLRSLEESGCEYAVIEQNTKAPYEDIEKSYRYLKSIKTSKE